MGEDGILNLPGISANSGEGLSTSAVAGEQGSAAGEVDVSVSIVNLNACQLLRDCLHSLFDSTRGNALEVIVVDNGSRDDSLRMLAEEFPQVRRVVNQRNEGYTRPTNQGLRLGQGRFLLLLNPDTVVLPGAIDRLVEFMESHPEAGICGPKVLNRDGSLQRPCRRGEPRPWAVISYFTGLSRLFPKSRLFGGYLLNYLPEDEIAQVDGVSGSCMLVRRAVVEAIGYLDERFFAYQEDADICHRARRAGWKVYYVPAAQIVHYGGMGGSRAQPYRSILAWHRSYFLYYRKNLAKDYFFLFNGLYYAAMLAKLGIALLLNLLRKGKFAEDRR